MSAVQYLLGRFRTDASALRERAAALRNQKPKGGPDAATSLRMAEACDEVVAMVSAIPDGDDTEKVIAALTALIPLLERRAAAVASAAPVRAVFVGAATRIREIADAEARAGQAPAHQDDDDVDEDEER
jgi:hypothetical protein